MTDWKNPPKLFIPGPVHVREDVRAQLARPVFGHRSKEYSQLQSQLMPMLKQILFTEQYVFLGTCSGSGIWEAAIRNCVDHDEKVLNVTCGAFSEKWHNITIACGRTADKLSVPWGSHNSPESIEQALASGDYSAVTIVHNETSTGLTNPLQQICRTIRSKYPDVLILVDAVSGMVGLPLKIDEWGIDVCFASVQKAWAIPPGLTVFTVSERAMRKSSTVSGRGYYFDFQQFRKSAEKNQTPTTPAIPHIMALIHQAEKLLTEGMENVWARHRRMAQTVRDWAKQRFALFVRDESYASNTLTCVANTRGINIAELNEKLQRTHNAVISNGYGQLKEKTFRISHMGEITVEELQQLLQWLDELIEQG